MDGTHNDIEPPPPKRIKLEEDLTLTSLSSDFPTLSAATTSTTTASRRGRKTKKSNEEKARELLKDQRLSAVEPHQVLCRMCGHWIKLFRHTEYARANWRAHAERCQIKTQWLTRVKHEPEDTFSLTLNLATVADHASPNTHHPPEPSTSTMHERLEPPLESVSANTKRAPSRSFEERATLLRNDPRVAGCDAHSVDCRLCGGKVRLHNVREYDSYNWYRHVESCEKKRAGGGGGVTSAGDVAGSVSAPVANGRPSLNAPKLRSVKLQLAPVTEVVPTPIPPPPDPQPAAISAPVKSEANHDMDALYSYTPALKKKKGRNVSERKEGLQQDPRCGEVQPHQVFCLMCNRWIKLYREVEYIDSNWLRHAERCSIRMSHEVKSGIKPSAEGSKANNSSKATTKGPKEIAISSETGLPQRSTQQREALLRTDPLIKEVEPKRVRCKMCDEWVSLNADLDFDPCNWQSHLATCRKHISPKSVSHVHPPPTRSHAVKSDTSISAPPKPRDTRTYEERRQSLEDDDRCEQVEEHRVFCRLCQSYIGLHAKKDYSTSNWIKHVTSCERKKSTKRKREDPSPTEDKPVLPLMTTRALTSSSSTPGASSSGTAAAPPMASAKIAPNYAQQPLVVPGFPSFNGTSASTAKVKRKRPITEDPPMTPLSALVNPPPSASPTLPLDQQPAADGDPVQRAIAQAVAQVASSGQTSDLRMAAEERKQRLLKDDRVGDVEPNRVLCKLCQRWYKLSNDVEYASYNWYKHIKRCGGKAGEPSDAIEVEDDGPSELGPAPTRSETPIVVKEEPDVLPKLFTREPLPNRRTTATERFARLQKDTRIRTLEPHRAECDLCGKWIKLQNKTEYDPHNWITHITKCAIKRQHSSTSAKAESAEHKPPASNLSFHAKMETRIAEFLDDPRCAVAEPKRVQCNLCKQWIKLRDDQQYSLTNWHKHIERCEKHINDDGTRDVVERLQRQHRQPQQTPSVVVKTEAAEISISTGRQRRTEAEREAELRADPRLAVVEPGRVYCKMCSSWIKLNAATGFLPSNWHRHSERCERKHGWNGEPGSSASAAKSRLKPRPPINPQFTSSEVIDLVDDGDGIFGAVELGHLVDAFEPAVSSTEFIIPDVPNQGVVGPSSVSLQLSSRMAQARPVKANRQEAVSKRGHRTTAFRKAELEADPRTRIVEPSRILCNMCDKWIQTRHDVSYSGQNWLKHAGICEQRSGWLAGRGVSASSSKAKPPPITSQLKVETPISELVPDVEMHHEPDLPYTARQSAMYEKSLASFGGEKAAQPSFKPIDWYQVLDDGEDDGSEMEVGDIAALSVDAVVDESSTTAMDVDFPLDLQMDEIQCRQRLHTGLKNTLTIETPSSPTLLKAKPSFVESVSPARLRASLSPVNAFTILSHPSPRAVGMSVDSPTAGFIAPISI